MKFFDKNKKEDYTVIIGCGRLGASLANALSNRGKEVLILDQKKTAFRRLASNFGGLSVVGSGTDFEKLREARIERASAVIVVTNDDNTNIMAAQIAKEVFGRQTVIARLYDPECEVIYKQLGISTICPSVLSAIEIDKLLNESPEEEEVS